MVLVRSVVSQSHEHWKKSACMHSFCRACLTGYISSKIADRVRIISCPFADPACACHLYQEDVKRIAPDLSDRYLEICAADYSQRLDEEVDQDFVKYINESGSVRIW